MVPESTPSGLGRTGPLSSRSEATPSKELHENDDLDQGEKAHHHTLGLKAGQAAPGVLLAELIKRVEALEEDA